MPAPSRHTESSVAAPAARRAKGEATRAHILDVAEQLFAERGVDGVSLREIRLAAGQRNASALQFHFGDRDGLLAAIAERHVPRVDALLAARARHAHTSPDPTGRRLTEALVLAPLDYLDEGASARAWVRICAELMARPELGSSDFLGNMPHNSVAVIVDVFDLLAPILPRTLAAERLYAVGLMGMHLVAARARVEAAEQHGRGHLSRAAFAANLADMAHAALFAPPTEPRPVRGPRATAPKER